MNINRMSGVYRQMNNYQVVSSLMTQRATGGAVSSIPKVGPANMKNFPGSLSADSLTYVKQYQSKVTELQKAAKALQNPGMADSVVSSSNTNVAEIASTYKPSGSASYELNVTQLAAAQVNRTDALDTTGTDFTGDFALTTAAGSFTFQVDAAGSSNLDAMNQLAKDINAAKTGVNASVAVKDGKATLELAADKTGESAAFQVNGSAAVQSGANTAVQKAQNAQYTVKTAGSGLSPVQRSSESNTIAVDSSLRIQAKLKNTGTATVGVTADNGKTADGIQKMVDAYNSNLKLLNDNADRGTGGLTQMKRMLLATGNEKSMAMLGINANKDGTLSFDRGTFLNKAAKSPAMVKDALGGSFGVATRLYNAASRGLGSSSGQLLSQDLKNARLQQASFNPGTYGPTGNTNQNAYQSIGALFNILV